MSCGGVPERLACVLRHFLNDEVPGEIRKSPAVFRALDAYGMAAGLADFLRDDSLGARALAVYLPGKDASFVIDAGIGAEGGKVTHRAEGNNCFFGGFRLVAASAEKNG